jgi:hypothetical protein
MFQDMKHGDEVKSAVLPDRAADGSMTHRISVLFARNLDRPGGSIHTVRDKALQAGEMQKRSASAADIEQKLVTPSIPAGAAL